MDENTNEVSRLDFLKEKMNNGTGLNVEERDEYNKLMSEGESDEEVAVEENTETASAEGDENDQAEETAEGEGGETPETQED